MISKSLADSTVVSSQGIPTNLAGSTSSLLSSTLSVGPRDTTDFMYRMRTNNPNSTNIGNPFTYGTLLDPCENITAGVTGWSNVANATVSFSNTHKISGAGCVKVVNTNAGAGNVAIQRTITSTDVSSAFTVSFWVYVEAPTDPSYISWKFTLSTTTDGAGNATGNGKSFQGNMTSKSGWNFVEIPIGRFNGTIGTGAWADFTTITYLQFQAASFVGGAGALVFYLDDIRFNTYHKPVVVPWFDDQWGSAYNIAFPVMQSYNIKGTMAVISNNVGTANYCTTGMLQNMYNAGWDMVNHSWHHIHTMTTSATGAGFTNDGWQLLLFSGSLSGGKFKLTGSGITTANIAYASSTSLATNIASAIQASGIAWTGSTTITSAGTYAASATIAVASTTNMIVGRKVGIGENTHNCITATLLSAAGGNITLDTAITVVAGQRIRGWMVTSTTATTNSVGYCHINTWESSYPLMTLSAGSSNDISTLGSNNPGMSFATMLTEYQTCHDYLVARGWTRNNCHKFIAYPYGEFASDGSSSSWAPDPRIKYMFNQLGCLAARTISTSTGTTPKCSHGGQAEIGGHINMLTVFAGSTDGNRLYSSTVMNNVRTNMLAGAGVIPIMFHRVYPDTIAAGGLDVTNTCTVDGQGWATSGTGGTNIHLSDFTEIMKELAAMRDAGLIEIKTVSEWYAGLNYSTMV